VFAFVADIMSSTYPDELIELHLDCRVIAVLRVLNQEHHEKGNTGRARVNHELPRI